ncbi:pentatricopeptide repeat-containing protein At4g21880, mitochondrial-like, partial [Gastrolobium bilobum]|uniref:pentatricopeptide repeat-containing protein At4g21880, mitochondrial-like n=1 Tax=Gastrolobium bilobum TaxID=150636 RepID=UPI002AAFD4B5
MCSNKLGSGTTIDLFGYLGRETGVKEYNALLKMCVKRARATNDEYISIEELSKAYHLFKSMRECGFQLEEQTYCPLLRYIIDMGLVQEFQLFSDMIKAENPSSTSRLGYYEMMLWLRVNNEEMIRDICEYITVEDSDDTSALRESYLLALCESDRKAQILDVLKNIDITKLSSAESIANIFQSLGQLMLESVAETLLLDLRASDLDADNMSNFIASYAVSIPNLAVEDIISKIKNLHETLEVLPSSSSYEKLIFYCCGLHKVDVALDIVDIMCKAGFTLTTEVLQSILQICEETYEYILVHRIYSIICRYHLELNGEICRCLVQFCVRIKDFEGAYKMIDNLEEMNFKPTPHMYNAIMAGYFREKNISGGLRVYKRMQDANVKPDSQTFSYLIMNCETEDDIIKVEEVYGVLKSKKSSEAQASGASGATGSTSEKGKKMDDRSIKERLQAKQSEEKFKRSGSQQSWDNERPLVPQCDNCGRHHKGVCLMGQNVCFKCARPGHYARDCPQIVGRVAHVQVVYDPSAAANVSTSTQPQLERFPRLTG